MTMKMFWLLNKKSLKPFSSIYRFISCVTSTQQTISPFNSKPTYVGHTTNSTFTDPKRQRFISYLFPSLQRYARYTTPFGFFPYQLKLSLRMARLTLLNFSPSWCGSSDLKDWNPLLMLCMRRLSLLLAISRRILFSCSIVAVGGSPSLVTLVVRKRIGLVFVFCMSETVKLYIGRYDVLISFLIMQPYRAEVTLSNNIFFFNILVFHFISI